MKETPILFSKHMIAAILEGRKSQTRRVVPQTLLNKHGELLQNRIKLVNACPYGRVGDSLWVKEDHYSWGHWEKVVGAITPCGGQKYTFCNDSEMVLFDPPPVFRLGHRVADGASRSWYKRPARYMFKKDSRLRLEVVDVRVERLCSITESDAEAEGVTKEGGLWVNYMFPDEPAPLTSSAAGSFASLWESIHGDGSFAMNPLVFVIKFHDHLVV